MNIDELIGFFILNGFEAENVNHTLDIISDRKSIYFNNVKNDVSFWLHKVNNLYIYEFHPGSFYSQVDIERLKSLKNIPFSISRLGEKSNDNSQKIMVTISYVMSNFALRNKRVVGYTQDGKEFPLFTNEREFLDYCYDRSN